MVYYAFDLLQLDGVDVAGMTLLERKERLATILKNPPAGIALSEHEGGDGEVFWAAAPYRTKLRRTTLTAPMRYWRSGATNDLPELPYPVRRRKSATCAAEGVEL